MQYVANSKQTSTKVVKRPSAQNYDADAAVDELGCSDRNQERETKIVASSSERVDSRRKTTAAVTGDQRESGQLDDQDAQSRARVQFWRGRREKGKAS